MISSPTTTLFLLMVAVNTISVLGVPPTNSIHVLQIDGQMKLHNNKAQEELFPG